MSGLTCSRWHLANTLPVLDFHTSLSLGILPRLGLGISCHSLMCPIWHMANTPRVLDWQPFVRVVPNPIPASRYSPVHPLYTVGPSYWHFLSLSLCATLLLCSVRSCALQVSYAVLCTLSLLHRSAVLCTLSLYYSVLSGSISRLYLGCTCSLCNLYSPAVPLPYQLTLYSVLSAVTKLYQLACTLYSYSVLYGCTSTVPTHFIFCSLGCN